ncbi:MAG: hypothetical protein GY822_00490 [Deltaproteobacteria bacterium]|nr:hypothetical protein [Deltaproteobacteria bacterium]
MSPSKNTIPTLMPLPPYAAHDDDDLIRGEVVLFPCRQSRQVELFFKAAWEPRVLFDGVPIRKDNRRSSREILFWIHANLPALHRILGQKLGLIGTLDDNGHVIVTALVDLQSGDRKSHGVLRREIGSEGLRLPAFALLGRPSSKAELQQRARAMYATGTMLELRGEEEENVIDCRILEVGR